MIERYSDKRVSEIWDDKNKFETYLKVEISALKAWVKEGMISQEELDKIISNTSINLDRIREIELETKHDVIAFTRSLSEQLGDEKKWIHYGLTSTDVVDTAYAVQFKQVNKIILESLNAISSTLKEMAFEYKDTPVMGRTHGVHAEITSLGLKFALWYDEMQRNISRFNIASKDVEVGKISGAVGNFANTPIRVQEFICNDLEIGSSKISTQTLQRDRHANYISTLAIIGTTIEKIATEIRNSQRTEVREMMEGFAKGQKGSSAMPHKRNPISSENLVGISRILKGYVIPALEDNALWYERDISHSSVERVIIPDSTNLIVYSLNRLNNVLNNLIINKEQMINNINLTKGVIFSQRVMTTLIEKGMSREEAYDKVQPLAIKAWEEQIEFKDLLIENNLITEEDVKLIFDINFFLRSTDEILERVFNA